MFNPERTQDRVADLFDHWRQFGYLMFPRQRRIYDQIAERVRGRVVLEAGCGTGQGTAVLARATHDVVGTDKEPGNVGFAAHLYPWVPFAVWDISHPGRLRADVVVCVETVEHVADAGRAVLNLLNAAREELWISTPNGLGKPRPPDNPFHCVEYTAAEMTDFILREPALVERVQVLDWETFQPVGLDAACDPVVYRVTKR